MRVTRRTIRTAAIATGTIAALALPTAGAFAADNPAEQGDQGSQSDQSSQSSQSDQQQPQVDPPVERAFIKSFKLADGSVAKVYQTGTDQYAAEIWAGGSLIDTLTTTGSPAYGQNNGLHVVLQPDGTVTSWVEGGPKPEPKPEPKPDDKKKDGHKDGHKDVSSVRITLPDGRVAKLVQGPHGPRAVISMPNGNHLGTLDLRNPTATNDGWTYKIVVVGKGQYRFVVIDTPKQGGNSWVYDFHGRLVEKYQVQKKPAKPTKAADEKVTSTSTHLVPQGTVPKGAVKAGAENVAGFSSQAALVGAGGGLAALGAAGLGFALYQRRGQRQER
ncbi:hypothetical protein ACF09C_10935 [Streptomyces sp. NPDC014870]|uniref:hypothetical protein n=1 Tax=Streptomyces sp. NPDC014870 TaxID=3364925 RepID=UPI0036FFE8D2